MDLFGFKKRRAKRMEVYKETYRAKNADQRRQHYNTLVLRVYTNTFYDKALMEILRAAVEVEEEEEAELTAGRSYGAYTEGRLH